MTSFDLLSPQVRDNPHEIFAELRRAAPLVSATPFGMWAVSRYDDVRRVLENSLAFRPRPASSPAFADPEPFEATLLVDEPPSGSAVGGLVRKALGPELLGRHERKVRSAAHALVDRVLERDNLDLIGLLALPLPAASMADLLGVAPARRAAFMRWASEAISPATGASGGERMRKLRVSMDGFVGYLSELLAGRRAEPGDDLLSALTLVEEDGLKLSDSEILTVVLHLLLAGNEATADLIGNVLRVLVQHRDVYDAVRADPSRIPALIEETLRLESPVLGQLRIAHGPATLGDSTIPGGAMVLALCSSANRDPAHFTDPDRFDLDRDNTDSLTLGLGGQEALWAPRARLEARVAIEVLFDRLPDFGPGEGEVQWCSALLFRGPRVLPIAYSDEGEE